jgi:hypothetical protein
MTAGLAKVYRFCRLFKNIEKEKAFLSFAERPNFKA